MIFTLFLPLVEGPIDLSRFFICFTKDELYNYNNSDQCRLEQWKIAHHSISLCCRV